ncbi:FUSC family protein [Flavobacterium sp. N1736]|uniref:FUSC family protein n=1 Tax=Flavobacterium sp. N1736 TaxID=2986823 RepID=UPI002225A95C|nr:FUSC family protein [Flavobacterium sp. N1736]
MIINGKKRTIRINRSGIVAGSKKMKSAAVINALLIGFLIGIVFYSFLKSALGLLTLIPLFFAYKLINNSKYKNKELEDLLKERGLK